MTERVKASTYIEWAKLRAGAKFNLATSGVMAYPLAELPVSIEDLEINGASWYGYEPLQEALARKCEVETENVVTSFGTSMANHLAMAAVLEPGDEVLIERPAYDPLVSVAGYLGAKVNRFERRFEDGFRLAPEVIDAAVTNRTRLIVLTNLHNPTSVLADNETLSQVGEIAARVGARVLIDEVYREVMFEEAPPSSFRLGDQFIATGSLTKAYGLSGLRCGWILAEKQLAKEIWRLNDLFANVSVHAAERLSVVAFANLDRISARSKALLKKNRAMVDQFLNSRDDLEVVRPKFGTVVAPRLKRGTINELCNLLREKYETSVVPGSFFEMPDHFRLGFGCDSGMLLEGLARLSQALDDLNSKM